MTGWPNMQPEAAATPAPVEDEAAFLARRNHEIQSWLTSKETAVTAVEHERDWRSKVSKTLFPTPKKGTQRYQLSGGYSVKLVYVLNYKLGDADKVDDSGAKVPITRQVQALQDTIATIGNSGAVLADRLIKWKPELDVKEYEALDDAFEDQAAIKAEIDKLLTITPGTPQLTFEEPKPAK